MKRTVGATCNPYGAKDTASFLSSRLVVWLSFLIVVAVGVLPSLVLGDCRGVYSKMCTPDSGDPGRGRGSSSGGCSGENCPENPWEVLFGVDKDARLARKENSAGVSAWKNGDYASALRHFEEASRLKPGDEIYSKNVNLARETILLNAANAANSRGDYREALRLGRELAQVPGAEYNKAWLSWLESRVTYEDGDALWKQGKTEEALVLFRKAADNPKFGDAEWREWLTNEEARAKRARQNDKAELARKAERARNLPKANRLNDEAVTLLQQRDADAALRQLTAARELVGDDPRINANWYIAKANIAHRNGQLDNVISNLENAVSQDPSNAEARSALEKARAERAREGENIRQASAGTLERLRNASSGGPAANAGEQLGRTEHHGRDASKLEKEPSAEEAREGFDRAATKKGATLVYPGISGRSPSLASTIPAAGRNDPVIKDMVAWHDQLEARKADIDRKIEAIKEQQKTSKEPSLAVRIESLTNEKRRYSDDQKKAKEKIGVRLRNLSIDWDESGDTNAPAPSRQAKQLEFIED